MLPSDISSAARNTFKLTATNALGYGVGLALIPFLSRAYSPEAFGDFALFMGLTIVLGTGSTLRYEKAVFISKSEDEQRAIAQLAYVLCLSVALIVLVCVLIAVFIGQLDTIFLLLPLCVFGHGIILIETAFGNVSNRYLRTGIARGFQTALASLFALLIADLAVNGLIIGLAGALATVAIGLFACGKTQVTKIEFSELRQIANKHRNFARYTTPHEMFAAVSSRATSLLIPIFFGSSVAGLFFMAQKLITIPCVLISGSASQVYFHELGKKIAQKKDPAALFVRVLSISSFISILVFLTSYLALPRAVPLILGDQWNDSIRFAQLLVPWATVYLVGSILSQTPQACGYQAKAMFIEIVNGVLRFSFLALGFLLENAFIGIGLFLASSMFFTLWRIAWYYRLTHQMNFETDPNAQ